MKVNLTGNEIKITKDSGEQFNCLISNIALIEYLLNNEVRIHFKFGPNNFIKCKTTNLYINGIQTTKTNFEASISSYAYDGLYARIIQFDATYTYIAEAIPGTLSNSASWRAKKVVTATGVTTWANGDSNFDNIATDLTALNYL